MKIDDVRTILRALNDANVRYLIVGGLAVVAHGYVRFTQDIDLVVQLERENVLRAMNALTAIGYRPLIPVDAHNLQMKRCVSSGEMKRHDCLSVVQSAP
jgi:hypothetical protein